MLKRISMAILALLWLNTATAANSNTGEDLRGLVKELVGQVKTMQAQLSESNARIQILEQQLKATAPAGLQQAQAIPPSPSLSATSVAPSATSSLNGSVASQTSGSESKPPVSAGDIKGTIKIPGTDTSIGIGGYVKLDALYNSVSAGRDRLGDQRLEISQIPVGKTPPGENSQITFHAKESRLWFKSFTPNNWGDISTYLELDFYGDAATTTYTPRLRHAYGSMGNFLAGQTWTTFLNTAAYPDTLDNSSAIGAITALRQPQVRWTQAFSLDNTPMEWQLALEAPRSRLWVEPPLETALDATLPIVTPNAERYPDIITRLNYNPGWGNLSLAAMARNLRYTNPVLGLDQEKWGGAISLAGKISTFGLDNIRFMLNYGGGLGRYFGNGNAFEDATLSRSNGMNMVTGYSAMLAYQHWWDKTWRSTLAYGYAHADQPGYVAGILTEDAQSLHANLLWSPILQATIGLEYIYAQRQVVDGREGDLQRVQFSTRFSF